MCVKCCTCVVRGGGIRELQRLSLGVDNCMTFTDWWIMIRQIGPLAALFWGMGGCEFDETTSIKESSDGDFQITPITL